MSDGVQAIRHGMFIMPFHDPAKPLGRGGGNDMIWGWASGDLTKEQGDMFGTRGEKRPGREARGSDYTQNGWKHPPPPIAIPGMSRNSPSMKIAGQRGYQPFVHCIVA